MSFSSLGLAPSVLRAIEEMGYQEPTAIQTAAIPSVLEGKDILAEAQTGSGKTASFALPILHKLTSSPAKSPGSTRALILTPTRELAIQVGKAFKQLGQYISPSLQIVTLIGGETYESQTSQIIKGATIIVATPGRLLDMIEHKDIDVSGLEVLVFDEADKILNLGFAVEMDQILTKLPSERQNLLYSATLPKKLNNFVTTFLKDPVTIKIAEESIIVPEIHQRVIEVNRMERGPLLRHLIEAENWHHVLVFVASKKAAQNLAAKLNKYGIKADAFHGDLNQQERNQALANIRHRKVRILVCTDIAARGIDIDQLQYVVNFDLPRSPADYVHRIGRTGRAGATGMSVTFIDAESSAHFALIEKRAQIKLLREQITGFEPSAPVPTKKVAGAAPVKGKRKSKKDKKRENIGS